MGYGDAGPFGYGLGWQPKRSLTPRGTESTPRGKTSHDWATPFSSASPEAQHGSTRLNATQSAGAGRFHSSSASSSIPGVKGRLEPTYSPRRWDRTWGANQAGSQAGLRNVLATPRSRSVAPRGEENGAHLGMWAQICMPKGRVAAMYAEEERRAALEYGIHTPREGLTGAQREQSIRKHAAAIDEIMRERRLQQLGRDGVPSSPAAALPRGRYHAGVFANSAWNSSGRGGSDGAHSTRQVRSWAERTAAGRAAAASGPPSANPHAYKASMDQGRLQIVANVRRFHTRVHGIPL